MSNGDRTYEGYTPTSGQNGQGFWAGMPWYVKAIAIVGVPSILSLAMVWSDRVQLLERIDQNGAVIAEMQRDQREHIIRDTADNRAVVDATKETNRILLATCVNDATTKPDPVTARERCVGSR